LSGDNESFGLDALIRRSLARNKEERVNESKIKGRKERRKEKE
jgi:hypothetical protein